MHRVDKYIRSLDQLKYIEIDEHVGKILTNDLQNILLNCKITPSIKLNFNLKFSKLTCLG